MGLKPSARGKKDFDAVNARASKSVLMLARARTV